MALLDYKTFSDIIEEKGEYPEINILILNAPCNGFGDVIFAYKLKKYLKEWYPFCKIIIATTRAQSFYDIGENPHHVISLKSKSEKIECRLFSEIEPTDQVYGFDLIFIAPLQKGFEPDHEDIKTFVPYSNRDNTYIFSEYNDKLEKDITFQTGVGQGRDGMLFTNVPPLMITRESVLPLLRRLNLVYKKFAICYIATTLNDMKKCYISFFEMISKKYKSELFSIVIPEKIAEDVLEIKDIDREYIFNNIFSNFSTIVVTTKHERKTYYDETNKENRNTLFLRGDIFPLKNYQMTMIMHSSVDDILVTGDQSITDVLSCCPTKNIFYQIAPWKTDFANELSINMPNQYLESRSTSCGSRQIPLEFQSDYTRFVMDNDFRKLARPKLNQIINLAISVKTLGRRRSKHLSQLYHFTLRSKTPKKSTRSKTTKKSTRSKTTKKSTRSKTTKKSTRSKTPKK